MTGSTTIVSSTESTSSPTTTSQPSGMDAVFQMQWWICELMGTAAQNSAEQARQQSEMSSNIVDFYQENYDEICDAIEEKKKYEKESHSFGGFFKNLGNLLASLSQTIADLSVGVVTGAVTGDFDKTESQLDSDFKKLAQNPAVKDLLVGLNYVVMASAIVMAGAAGGPAAAVAVAAILASSQAGGLDLLSNSFQSCFEAIGLPPSAARLAGDVMTIATVAMVAAATGGAGATMTGGEVAGMAGSTATIGGGATLGALSGNLATDFAGLFGLTGEAKTYFTVGATISFALLGTAVAFQGGKMATKYVDDLSPFLEKMVGGAGKVSGMANIAEGGLGAIRGFGTIKVGELMEKITEKEADNAILSQLLTNLTSVMQMTQNQATNAAQEYATMISQFGTISAAGRQASAV